MLGYFLKVGYMKLKWIIVSTLIILIGMITYIYYINYEGDYYEVAFVYHKVDGSYVVVGETSIKVSDDQCILSAKHIINDPFNHQIQSPVSYNIPNSYMFEDMITLYDENKNIYVVKVDTQNVTILSEVETYQINKDRDEMLVLKNQVLYKYNTESFDSLEVQKDILSFVATDDFKSIYAVTKDSDLIHINQYNQVTNVIVSGMDNNLLTKVEDYIVFNHENKGYIYNIKKQKIINIFNNAILLSRVQYIDASLLIQSGPLLYVVKGESVDQVRGQYLLTENISDYYIATNRSVNQMRGKVQVLLLDMDENIYTFHPKEGRNLMDLNDTDQYVGAFSDELSYVFNSGVKNQLKIYNQDNEWNGETVNISTSAKWVKGHHLENFIFQADEKALLQMYNGETVIPINILAEHFKKLICGGHEDYYVIDDFGISYINSKGDDIRVLDNRVDESLFDPSDKLMYFIDYNKTLYKMDKDDLEIVDDHVKEIALFRNSIYYIKENGDLINLNQMNHKVIDEGVLDMSSITTNKRIMGSYSTVHMFYILEEK